MEELITLRDEDDVEQAHRNGNDGRYNDRDW